MGIMASRLGDGPRSSPLPQHYPHFVESLPAERELDGLTSTARDTADSMGGPFQHSIPRRPRRLTVGLLSLSARLLAGLSGDRGERPKERAWEQNF